MSAMINRLYVRTTLTVPGAGTAIHIAQLREMDVDSCKMEKLIALAPNDAIVGAAAGDAVVGDIDKPKRRVPHPNTYDQFDDVDAEYLTEDEFQSLWAEAQAKYPRLKD